MVKEQQLGTPFPLDQFLNSSSREYSFTTYSFPTFAELGFGDDCTLRVEKIEVHEPIRSLGQLIGDFWADYQTHFQNTHQHHFPKESPPCNDLTYGMFGLSGIRREGDALVIPVFEMDYATTVFSGMRRGRKWGEKLSPDQLDNLNSVVTVGIVNVVRYNPPVFVVSQGEREENDLSVGRENKDYRMILLGRKTGTGPMGGLWETIGTGLVSPSQLREGEDLFRGATRVELVEEANLSLEHDVSTITPFCLSIGGPYRDFSLVSVIDLAPGAAQNMRISEEHEYGIFVSPSELNLISPLQLNPVTEGVLRKMGLYRGG